MADKPAPNRLFDFTDMERPFFRRTIREMEDILARQKNLYLHPSKRWEYPWAVQRADLSDGNRVLDVGCGASVFPAFLSTRPLRVTAVDPSPPPPQHAASDPAPGYVVGRMPQLPFRAGTFDKVFCISVIEHLPVAETSAALAELARILKPGGRLLFTTDYGQDAGETIWYDGEGEPFAVDWHIFDRTRLENLIESAAGLQVDGEIDLEADWPRIRKQMRRFHGYPYTSVGIAFIKN